MLVDNFYSSSYGQSFAWNNIAVSNNYESVKNIDDEGMDACLNKTDVSLQPNLFNLIFILCLISSHYSFDSVSSYESKINSDISIAPEVYKSSQEFWWNQKHYLEIYKLESTNQGKSASAYTTVLMHHAVRFGDLRFLNIFFEKLNKSQLTSWSLIALLRSTSVYKQDILLWKEFYLFTRELVEKEGLNPKRELYGLDRGISL